MIGSYLDSRYFLIIAVVFFVASCGGSSGGGGSSGNSFPTPTVPAGARTIDGTNANDTATSAVTFVSILSAFSRAKSENQPTVAEVVDSVLDHVHRRSHIARTQNAYKTEDVSADFCFSGTAIGDFDETATSESGTITFTNCDVGSGVIVNGELAYDSNWNDTTLDYSLQIGGTLTFDFGGTVVTIVLNFRETGNDGTTAFSTDINFSLAGIPGGGFLVTTTQNVVGDSFVGASSGQLIVTGASSSRLRLTVIGPNSISVELDTGGGTFVPCAMVVPACMSPVMF